jgi:hypothetical protein
MRAHAEQVFLQAQRRLESLSPDDEYGRYDCHTLMSRSLCQMGELELAYTLAMRGARGGESGGRGAVSQSRLSGQPALERERIPSFPFYVNRTCSSLS